MNAPAETHTVRDPLAPAQLGPVKLRNRVIKAATSEGRSPNGLVTDDLIQFHRSYAEGGVGMTTVAFSSVAKTAVTAPGQVIMNQEAVPGLRKLADAVHDAGAAVSAQLGHGGVVSSRKFTGVRPMGPSRFVHPVLLHYCRPMGRDDIERVISQFADAAAVAVDAGFDAVELHFGHLYLPSSFLSPLINRRKDEYGGSIDNRSRLVREIAARVRDVVGDRIAITAKICMFDGMRGGISLPESTRTVELLDADGNLDAIELTQGSSVLRHMYMFRGDTPVDEWAKVFDQPLRLGVRLFGKSLMGEYSYEDMFMLESARQFVPIVKNTKLVLLGGITNHDHALTAMREGFDFVAMGRALLREPDLVDKWAADPSVRSRCNHNNKCMVTLMVGRAHCVLDLKQQYSGVPDIGTGHRSGPSRDTSALPR